MTKKTMIPFTCVCGKKYNVPAAAIGKRGRCPNCGIVIRVTNPDGQKIDGPTATIPFTDSSELQGNQEQAAPQNVPGDAGSLSNQSNTEQIKDSDRESRKLPEDETEEKPKKSFGAQPAKSVDSKNRKSNQQNKSNGLKILKEVKKIKEIKKKVDKKVLGEDPDKEPSEQRYDYRRLSKFLFVFLAVFCVVFLGYLGKLFWEGSKAARAHKELQANVLKAKAFEQKQFLYKNFIAENPESKYVEEVRKQLETIPALIDIRDFRQIKKKEKELGDNLEEIQKIYLQYVEKHPRGEYMAGVEKVLSEMPARIDERDYQSILDKYNSHKESPDEAEAALKEYLDKHPDGQHAQQIQTLLDEIPLLHDHSAYDTALKKIDELPSQYEDWTTVLSTYLEEYPRGEHEREVRDLLGEIPNKIDDRDFEVALGAEKLPFDQQKAHYGVYLDKHPEGRHVSEIKERTEKIPEVWAEHIKTQAVQMEDEDRQNEALELYRKYLDEYPDTEHAKDIEARIGVIRKMAVSREDERDYQTAAGIAKKKEVSLEQKKESFLAYLKAHPQGKYVSEARKNVHGIESRITVQKWENVRNEILKSKTGTEQSIQIVRGFLSEYPEGEHVENARDLLAKLSKKRHADLEGDAWQQTLVKAGSTKKTEKALRVFQAFIKEYPSGKLLSKARQHIVALEMRRYAVLAPYPPAVALSTLTISGDKKKEGYTLTGNVREFDARKYLVRDRHGDQYYVKKSDVLDIKPSPQAQYNQLIRSRNPRTSEEFLEIARWCEKAGFHEKGIINEVMAAYLNPENTTLFQQLNNKGFSYEYGRWTCKCSFW